MSERRACEGADTIDHGDMHECAEDGCEVSIRWDKVDDPFWGFQSSCPLKRNAVALGGEQADMSQPQTDSAPKIERG